MRTDTKPFDDARVRQAIALAVDRQGIVDGLFQGKSDLGNDSPFAPIFPQTDTTVAQRAQGHRQGQVAARRGRRPERLRDRAGRTPDPGGPGVRPDRGRRREGDRRHDQPQDRGRRHVLRRGRVRQVALARLGDEPRRLRPPRRPGRVLEGAAPLGRHLERGALQEPGIRQDGRRLHRCRRPPVGRSSSPAASSRSCSTTRRSSSPTSTTSSRPPAPASPACARRP